jgi:uncharacterized membrane protein/rhamnogalacturonyl hydrolase YesR
MVMRKLLAALVLVLLLLGSFPLVLDQRGPDDQEMSTPIIKKRGPGPTENPHLYHAEAGARWLISIANEPSPGEYKWYESDVLNTNYYLEQSVGVIGIAKFFLMLYQETGNATYLEYAEGSARWIISNAVVTAPDACKWSYKEGMTNQNDYAPDFYGGIGAVIEYLLWLYQETGNSTYLAYAEKGANFLIDDAVSEFGGYKWQTFYTIDYNMTGFYHGTAGLAYVLLELFQETTNTTYLSYAEGAATWLINIANVTGPGERAWVRVQEDPGPSQTWCGGTTGIVHFFLQMWDATQDTKYLDQARAGGNWTKGQAMTMGPGNKSISYTNIFCHGDPSDALILFELYNATKDTSYLDLAEQVMNWIISQKVDVNQNETKWPHLVGGSDYITGMLMGNSGIGHAFIKSYEITKNASYLDLAKRSVTWVENRNKEVSPGVQKWNYKELIDVNEEYCTGWYWGMAGIGQFLMEMVPYWNPPPYTVDILKDSIVGYGDPGTMVFHQFKVKNVGPVTQDIEFMTPEGMPDWPYNYWFDGSNVAPGEERTFFFNVSVPPNALPGDNQSYLIEAWGDSGSFYADDIGVRTVARQRWGVDILSDNLSLSALPGEWATSAPIDINNTGSYLDDIVLSHTPPSSGWEVQVEVFDGSGMAGGERRNVTVKVKPPVDALADEFCNVTLTATSQGNTSVTDSISINTTVGSQKDIEVTAENLIKYTDPGVPAEFNITIKNTGNVVVNPIYSIEGLLEDWMIGYPVSPISVGETRYQLFEVTSPKDALPDEVCVINLTIQVQGAPTLTKYIPLTTIVNAVHGVDILDDNITNLHRDSRSYDIEIQNTGNEVDSFEISISFPPDSWTQWVDFNGTDMEPGEVRVAEVYIERKYYSEEFEVNFTLTVSSVINFGVDDSIWIFFKVPLRVEMQVDCPGSLEGKPEEVLTYDCSVLNLGNVEDSYTFDIVSELGWDVLITGDGLHWEIRPNRNLDFKVQVTIPTDALPGIVDNVSVTVTSKYDTSMSVTANIYVTVLQSFGFDLSADQTTITIRPDESAVFNITVNNTGNVKITVDLEVLGGFEGWDELSRDVAILEVGGSLTLTLTITPEDTQPRTINYLIHGRSIDEDENLNLTVIMVEGPPPADDDDDDDDTSPDLSVFKMAIVIIIILIVFMLIIAIVLIAKLRSRKVEEDEADRLMAEETIEEQEEPPVEEEDEDYEEDDRWDEEEPIEETGQAVPIEEELPEDELPTEEEELADIDVLLPEDVLDSGEGPDLEDDFLDMDDI